MGIQLAAYLPHSSHESVLPTVPQLPSRRAVGDLTLPHLPDLCSSWLGPRSPLPGSAAIQFPGSRQVALSLPWDPWLFRGCLSSCSVLPPLDATSGSCRAHLDPLAVPHRVLPLLCVFEGSLRLFFSGVSAFLHFGPAFADGDLLSGIQPLARALRVRRLLPVSSQGFSPLAGCCGVGLGQCCRVVA